MENLEKLLNILADMNDFDSDPRDSLNQIIAGYEDEELSETDLELVDAAVDCRKFRSRLDPSDK